MIKRLFILMALIQFTAARSANALNCEQFVSIICEKEMSVNDSIKINYEFFIPRTYHFLLPESKLPLIIIFDRQNTTNFNQSMHTIDYLTGVSNIPQACVLSIGFQDGMERFMLSKYEEDGGYMQNFFGVINRQVDSLQKEYKLNFTEQLAIGHSRSGYIAMQYLFNYPNKIYGAIVGSPQDISSSHEKNVFKQFLNFLESHKVHRQLIFTAGLEEFGDGDELQTTALISFFKTNETPFFKPIGELLPCEHNVSLNFRLQENLAQVYSGYNQILLRSFASINSGTIEGFDDSKLDEIIRKINTIYSMDLQKDPTYYISLFYAFLNDYKSNYSPENRLKNAAGILQLGMNQFNNHIDFNYHHIFCLLEREQREQATKYMIDHLSDYQKYYWLDDWQMFEELESIKDLFQE